MAKLGRTFAGLNPMKRVKLSQLRPSFVPAVWYSKQRETSADSEKGNSLERARILKGDHIVSGEEVFKDVTDGKLMTLPRNYSIEDIDTVLDEELPEGDLDIGLEGEDNEGDVILLSCGILATTSSQVLSSILKDRRRAQSVDALYMMMKRANLEKNKGASSSDETKSNCSRRQAESKTVCLAKSRSLIENRKKRHHSSADLYDKKRMDTIGNQLEEILPEVAKDDNTKRHEDDRKDSDEAAISGGEEVSDTQDMLFTSEKEAHLLATNTKDDTDATTNKDSDILTQIDFTIGGHTNNQELNRGHMQGKKREEKILESEEFVEERDHETEGIEGEAGVVDEAVFDAETEAQNEAAMASVPSSHGCQVMDMMTEASGHGTSRQTLEQIPETAERPRHPKVQLIHPSMKLSFSDTSISTMAHEMEQYDVDLKTAELAAGGSPFSRLRVKMSSLALPTMSSPQTKRNAAQNTALQNKYISELRFKECKTRIILL